MSTCLAHLTRALRLINALAEGEQPNANQTADGLRAMSAMFGDWEMRGVPLGLTDTALTAGMTLPVPATHDVAVQSNLAVTLSPEYGVAISPVLAEMADTAFRTLQGQYADQIPMAVEPALLRGGGYRHGGVH